jgi:periplasmic divalent cation tolerance protein
MREAPTDVLIVLTNLPDRATAVKLAQMLIDKRLAACVNVLAETCSVYRWKGEVATESEVPVLIKTCGARYGEVEAAILAAHPYELPEIVAVPVVRGLPKYLEWVVGETVAD